MNMKKNLLAATATAATLAATAGYPADQIPQSQAVRNVVLVHGAFADGSGWRGVYDELTQRGYQGYYCPEPAYVLGRRHCRN